MRRCHSRTKLNAVRDTMKLKAMTTCCFVMQKVKGDERIACNVVALIASLTPPLRPALAATSGVLVSLGQCRTGCASAVQRAAAAAHSKLTARPPKAANGAQNGRAAQSAAGPTKGSATGAKASAARGQAQAAATAATQGAKLGDKGKMADFDEDVLAQLPPDEVRDEQCFMCLWSD